MRFQSGYQEQNQSEAALRLILHIILLTRRVGPHVALSTFQHVVLRFSWQSLGFYRYHFHVYL
jgi:hypothetical protein